MSIDWFERARKVIGQGYCTNSKNPATDFPFVPTHWDRPRGAIIHGPNGVPYIDLVSALGAIHWGHCEDLPIHDRYDGDLVPGCSIAEVLTAEEIVNLFGGGKVKFVNDGSEACSAAVRMARTFTGKDFVLSEGYHGWMDEFTGLNDDCVGVPSELRSCMIKFNLHELDEKILEVAAAVILEPVQLDDSEERIEELANLIEKCKQSNVIVIFDEVITGLRYPSGSVAIHWNLKPDLICCGKAFGNGSKAGFVVGREDILDGNYFVSGTYFAHIQTLLRIKKSISMLETKPSEDLCIRALAIQKEFNKNDIIRLDGWGTRCNFVGDETDVSIYRQEMFRREWFNKNTLVWNWCSISHDNQFIADSREITKGIKFGRYKLEYPLPKKPVAQRVRGQ